MIDIIRCTIVSSPKGGIKFVESPMGGVCAWADVKKAVNKLEAELKQLKFDAGERQTEVDKLKDLIKIMKRDAGITTLGLMAAQDQNEKLKACIKELEAGNAHLIEKGHLATYAANSRVEHAKELKAENEALKAENELFKAMSPYCVRCGEVIGVKGR